MRRILLGVVAGMLLPLSPAQAADLDQTVISQVQQATQDASTPEQLAAAIETMLNSATSDAQKEAILAAAMSLNANNDAALTAIGSAANNANVDPNSVALAAITAQVSLTSVLAATAAGPGNGQQGQGLTIAPGQTGNAVTPPPFGSSAGGGGGGGASPSA